MANEVTVDELSIQETKEIPHARFLIWLSLVLSVAFLLRIYDIDLRPLHSDEGVNYNFAKNTLEDGFYPYSHENYHGPTFFFALTASLFFGGSSELSLRAPSIVFGVLMLLSLIPLRVIAGRLFVLVAASLLALSPGMVFYSRYAIHEMLFVLLSLNFAIYIYRWFLNRKRFDLFFSIFALSLLASTKETFIISLFCVSCGLFLSFSLKDMGRTIAENIVSLTLAFLMSLFCLVANYTSFFRYWEGLSEFLKSLPQWFGRGTGDSAHFKDISYYFSDILLLSEPYIVWGIPLCLLLSIRSFVGGDEKTKSPKVYKNHFQYFLLGWSVSSILVYSFIPYKTPWLVLNIVLPAVLLVSFYLSYCLNSKSFFVRTVGLSYFVLSITCALSNTAHFNFRTLRLPGLSGVITGGIPYGKGNPFSYVHTSRGMLHLVDDVESYWESSPEAKVLVATKHVWPLPFYFREKPGQVGYSRKHGMPFGTERYDIIVTERSETWVSKKWSKRSYALNDVQDSVVYFKKIPSTKELKQGMNLNVP
jgi:uncharacterized protein (TIGR03663 family)